MFFVKRRIISRCDLSFQLADGIGLDLNPVSLFSMAAWDEEIGEQFSTTELLNTVFSFLSVDVNSLCSWVCLKSVIEKNLPLQSFIHTGNPKYKDSQPKCNQLFETF